jgi:XTP/dITP diphosphohydrolase
MEPVMSIVVATSNRVKLLEIRGLLGDLPVEVLSAKDAMGDMLPNVVEDGDSFEANALKAARAIAHASMMVTLADDSGLEVDALGGRPGVRSARFAGEGSTDAENNAELLKRMAELDDGDRKARFRCAIALVDPWDADREVVVTGTCEGSVAHQPTGTGGFGYDPLFIVQGVDKTLAELDESERSQVSHRARALRELQPRLEAMIKMRLEQTVAILEAGGAR